MFVAWVIFHVIVCVALIIAVLMQSAKGEGLAGGTAFGGGVSNAVFGGRGAASFLSKATTVLAVVFFVNCGALALMSANASAPVIGGNGTETQAESAVTRRALEEQEQAMERQRLQQEQTSNDSLVNQGGEVVPAFNFDSIQPETPADDATSDN